MSKRKFQGVVFKQWYKSRNLSDIGIKNRKHLIYFSTKPEAVPNAGQNFALFGRLPEQVQGDITDFDLAKKAVTEASKKHTLYRSIISLDHDTALSKQMYHREFFEALMYEKVGAIAKEMNIAAKDFCWTAAFHQKVGHPHVHIMYWDNSDKVRQEHIPEARFEIMAEHIRGAFNGSLFRDELQQMRDEQKDAANLIKLELQALLPECNPVPPLPRERISDRMLSKIQEELKALLEALPKSGRLVYAYVPDDYKTQLDRLTDTIMQIPDFARQRDEILKITDELSSFYGNDAERTAFNREKEEKKLYKDVGNTILKELKEWRLEHRAETCPDVQQAAAEALKANPELQGQIQNIVDAMPKERTPMFKVLENVDVRKQYNGLLKALTSTPQVKEATENEIYKAQKEYRQMKQAALENGQPVTFDEKQAMKDLRSRVYGESWRAARMELNNTLCEQAGYVAAEQAAIALSLLTQIFRSTCQRGQSQARQLEYNHEWEAMSEKSETEQRNLMHRKRQGSWQQE